MNITYWKKDSEDAAENIIKDVSSISTRNFMGINGGRIYIYYRDEDCKSQMRFLTVKDYDFIIN